MNRRGVLRAAATAVLVAPLARLAQGNETYEVMNLEWSDPARQRPVPVRLYLPHRARVDAPVPLVVFSHGIGGSRLGYGYLGRHFAAHGIASLHLQHVGSDRALWSGNVFSLFSRMQSAAQEGEAIARVADLRFALDQAFDPGASGDLAARLDRTRIVAAGHSYGANTTLLAAGAQVEREGRPIVLRDERVRAALVISAPPFYGEPSPERVLGAVTLPTLHVTAAEDVIRIPGYYSGVDDRLKVFEATGSREKWLAVFNRGTHSGFVGRAGDASPVVVATKQLALAFVQQVVQGDEGALAAWRQQHAELLERFVAPPTLARVG